MVDRTMGLGRQIICMATGSTNGRTGGDTKGIMSWIRSMVMGFMYGLTAASTRVIGSMESNMVKVNMS